MLKLVCPNNLFNRLFLFRFCHPDVLDDQKILGQIFRTWLGAYIIVDNQKYIIKYKEQKLFLLKDNAEVLSVNLPLKLLDFLNVSRSSNFNYNGDEYKIEYSYKNLNRFDPKVLLYKNNIVLGEFQKESEWSINWNSNIPALEPSFISIFISYLFFELYLDEHRRGE